MGIQIIIPVVCSIPCADNRRTLFLIQIISLKCIDTDGACRCLFRSAVCSEAVRLVRYLGVMILAAAIMFIAFIGRDHRGTLFSDSMSAISSLALGGSNSGVSDNSYAALPNPYDQGQVKQYVQDKFNQGLSQSSNLGEQSSPAVSSDLPGRTTIASNSTQSTESLLNSLTGSADALPDTQNQSAINSYILEKFHEGQVSASTSGKQGLK